MKRAFMILGLLAAFVSARAELATNYYEFSLKLTPLFSTSPGPHSTLPFAPSLTVVTYTTDLGIVTEELTNSFATLDFSSVISSPIIDFTLAQPLWNAMQSGTNPVQFAKLELKGKTLVDLLDFHAEKTFESVGAWKHMGGWEALAVVGSGGTNDSSEIIPWMFLGNGFSTEAADIWTQYGQRSDSSVFPIVWPDAAVPRIKYSGDVWPGYQDYIKTGRVNPYDQQRQQIPVGNWDGDTNTTLTVSTNLNTGPEGYTFTVFDSSTNYWEFERLKVKEPLSNGGMVTNRFP